MKTPSLEIINLEKYFCEGVIPVISFKYEIKIDNKLYIVDGHQLTGQQLLALAGYTPETHLLFQKTRKGKEPIEPKEIVDFTACGIEKFITLEKSVTEGETPKREFYLPEDDKIALDELNLTWETINSGNTFWLILRNYPLPEGYNYQKADLAFHIPQTYPTAALDMVYVSPPLSRLDSKPINALTPIIIEGKNYQRWSRHRLNTNPWRAGEDNIITHLYLMLDSLQTELKK